MSRIAQQLLPLEDLAREAGLAARQAATIGRQAVADGVKKSRVHARRSAQEILAVKAKSINSRLSVRPPSAGRLEGELRFAETRLPLLTSFKFRGGQPGRFGAAQPSRRLRVKVRVGKPEEVHRGAFVRPNPNTQPGDGAMVSYQRQFKDGRFVGRLPYSRLAGPSIVGLALNRPGFADVEQDFLAEEITEQYETRIERTLERMGGRRASGGAG